MTKKPIPVRGGGRIFAIIPIIIITIAIQGMFIKIKMCIQFLRTE
jgi:hypothetical protein